jgi:trehalose 6-phosphate phosphatase
VRRALAPLLTDPSASAVVSDFDGTLSPIVDRPDLARPLPGTPALLARLAGRFATVAVVSGRPASFLWEHLAVRDGHAAGADVPAPRFVGLYGLEQASDDGRIALDPQASTWRPVIDEVVGRLRSSAPVASLVEAKGLAVTVHWRTAPDAESWAVAAVASEVERTGLRSHPGRCSLELRPPLSIDKGSVVRGLIEGCRAAVYFGDDLGDLPAFAALAEASANRGIVTVSVAVADTESPPEVLEAADLVLGSPNEAIRALEWLADSADSADWADGGA